MRKHRETFIRKGPDVILAIKVPSRIFPLVPSAATTECLKMDSSASDGQCSSVLMAIGFTARLAGLIVEIALLFPGEEPVMKCVLDGFSACLPLLAMFFLSTEPFTLVCMAKPDSLAMTRKDMGEEQYLRCVEAIDESADVSIRNMRANSKSGKPI